ncbi:MAG: hypothetical protein ACREUU_11235, partial [Gammaproteobacteria bacterium]
ILTSLAFAGALLGPVAFIEDTSKRVLENSGKQAVAFTFHGNTGCVLLEDTVFCGPGIAPNPMLLASTDWN